MIDHHLDISISTVLKLTLLYIALKNKISSKKIQIIKLFYGLMVAFVIKNKYCLYSNLIIQKAL
ncbi:hypothetical protein BGI40_07630 [Snodgrassella communis]|uniref:Uncharacterized protein n=1 Tax=Snodgrassella communis TaxID=2946699 RepID=A0A836MRJ7_9NEIS|nr:hypothetical protein SALWKB29_0280 [Snodgrassella communis]PIT12039.1 hypothetical protein BGI29_03130 [Snodgrassella communis]PIT29024.1 hypothetical protein BGI39_04645 [Snodgrassella communis]PIT29915.1 hypothetical protein BGI38_02090 [Snodgrassella communis]PIT33524.1 hypothetical protein BGI40_07630 [Snodgrassella communis]